MSDNLLVTKSLLAEKQRERMYEKPIGITDSVDMVAPTLGGRISKANTEEVFGAAMKSQSIVPPRAFRLTHKYGTPYDVPRKWSNGATMSVREAIRKGVLKLPADPQGATNTLLPDWQNLWEATRLDLSIRKEALPTVRDAIYNIVSRPNASRVMNLSEIMPYGVAFEANNGEGQTVPQGETVGGQWDTLTHIIYAAGFTWTLLAELFDESMDMGRLADAVALGYNALRDDLALDPIIQAVYAGAQQTAANALAGANRQELLYLTLEDGIDDLGNRTDPITGRTIDASGLVILANELDARHIARVAQGLPSTNERAYPALGELSRVIGYNGETIQLRDRVVTYTGATAGTAYLIKPNRYFLASVKRGLTVEVDMQPNVKTLSREERAYWFCEGIHNAEGIANFVQELTLPAW